MTTRSFGLWPMDDTAWLVVADAADEAGDGALAEALRDGEYEAAGPVYSIRSRVVEGGGRFGRRRLRMYQKPVRFVEACGADEAGYPGSGGGGGEEGWRFEPGHERLGTADGSWAAGDCPGEGGLMGYTNGLGADPHHVPAAAGLTREDR